MKQETLEEAAERIFPKHKGLTITASNKIIMRREAFIKGAKYQAERMYSEEEVLNLWKVYIKLNDGFMIRKSLPTRLEELIDWFEQNKKK
jgi:hypothetical protein